MIGSLFRRNPNFIEIYDNALSKKECEFLINHFEHSNEVVYGRTTNGVVPDYKKCLELYGDFDNPNVIENVIRSKLESCLKKYVKKYHFFRESNTSLGALDVIPPWRYCRNFNIQKFDGENDGFKIWHCEHGQMEESSKRILAWMFYLNNAKSGTEFGYYPTINPREGRCVIWPSSWTHIHKGVIPNKGIKYIVTGWVSFL